LRILAAAKGVVMSQVISAVYKNGHFIPLTPVPGLRDDQAVELRITPSRKQPHSLSRFVGVIGQDEADELTGIIAEEFEKVNPDEW
jgi:predicted DNA-binding antitoxin AbrB/MazE fold protein